MREFSVNSNDAGQRLDKFILKTVKGIPASLMYKAIRTKKIKVNRKRADEKQQLVEGDIVQMFLNDNLFSDKIESDELMTVTPRLRIVYEDENIIICDKSPGVLVHSGEGDGKTSGVGETGDRNTLIFHIQAYLMQKGEYNPESENSFSPALCNRIDRNTGGLVIAAKNASTLRDVNERIRNNKIKKVYLCAVHGKPEKNSDTLTDFLIKDSKNNKVKVLKKSVIGSKEIITAYSLAEYNKVKDISLLQIILVTGRTHQIRAHMASIGHSVLGDGKYANAIGAKNYGYKHQALYAYKLLFCDAEDSLSYINGKEFSADLSNIFFLKEFSDGALR